MSTPIINVEENIIEAAFIPTMDSLNIEEPRLISLQKQIELEDISVANNRKFNEGFIGEFTPEDERKYIDTIQRYLKSNPDSINLIEGKSSLRDILSFCLELSWNVTGNHDESMSISGSPSDFMDIENPPVVKCNIFNSVYAYFFKIACKFFKREDLLEKYKIILIKADYATDLVEGSNLRYGEVPHAYLGLISFDGKEYHLTGLDPYHTANPSYGKTVAQELLWSKLDFTSKRPVDLIIGFYKSVDSLKFFDPAFLGRLISDIKNNPNKYPKEMIEKIIKVIERSLGFEGQGIAALENSVKKFESAIHTSKGDMASLSYFKKDLNKRNADKSMVRNYLEYLKSIYKQRFS